MRHAASFRVGPLHLSTSHLRISIGVSGCFCLWRAQVSKWCTAWVRIASNSELLEFRTEESLGYHMAGERSDEGDDVDMAQHSCRSGPWGPLRSFRVLQVGTCNRRTTVSHKHLPFESLHCPSSLPAPIQLDSIHRCLRVHQTRKEQCSGSFMARCTVW